MFRADDRREANCGLGLCDAFSTQGFFKFSCFHQDHNQVWSFNTDSLWNVIIFID